MKNIFSAADILLPHFINEPEKAKKWAVIACDQFTSEPEYWQSAYEEAGKDPSVINIILPEAFLSEQSEKRLTRISEFMGLYKREILKELNKTFVFVRRTQSDGKIRLGLVGKIDLEHYDYSAGSITAVRATEGTVLERIPPRVAVRRNAIVEAPHIMLLIDDENKSVIEPLDKLIDKMSKLYDFDLMLGGGYIEGYQLSEQEAARVTEALEILFKRKNSSIKFAVGDGNHSLASAKARYEEIKKEIGTENAKKHPLRYALCEVVNLHCEALVFEPIYRLVKTSDKAKLLDSLEKYGDACGEGDQIVKCIFDGIEKTVNLGAGTHSLTVGTLQKFLDEYKRTNSDVEIDYIHGIDSIYKLASDKNSIGFVFDGMEKEELFMSVEKDGSLPRKTFSMGEARDKRYYIECRDIAE